MKKQIGYWLLTVCLLSTAWYVLLPTATAQAGGYEDALKDVGAYKAIFQVSQGSPKVNNLVFWAVRNAYQAPEVRALPKTAAIAVVFHGPVVKTLSSNREPFSETDWLEVQKFQKTLQAMKADGVRLEVCRYALKMAGIDPATILPEIDVVDNGFVSVIGYQMQGYAVVRIP